MVEDDIFVAPFFLKFMNDSLTRYREEPRVSCISGYCYPIEYHARNTFFLRGAECWGWATWADRWSEFNNNSHDLLLKLRSRGLSKAFDLDGAFAFTQMLEDDIAGRVDSWGIRWHASCFLKNMLTLYPARSLVQNIGFDGVGSTHAGESTLYDVDLAVDPVPVASIELEEDVAARHALQVHFRRAARQSNPSAVKRMFRRIAGISPRRILEMATELRRQS
jgi:hypothetical protein